MRPNVLVVEDDENLRVVLADNLEASGYAVSVAATLAEARTALRRDAFELVVLDLMLPDGDGYALCRELRAAGTPTRVLMLTARTLEDDIVRGFDAGADDYLLKPYRLRELHARVRALLRRDTPRVAAQVLSFAGFRVDLDARAVRRADGQDVSVTRTELDLLAFFIRHEGRALRRDDLLDAVWGREVVVDERTVDNFVSSLKKKLGWSEGEPWRIRTVRGVGYRFEVDAD